MLHISSIAAAIAVFLLYSSDLIVWQMICANIHTYTNACVFIYICVLCKCNWVAWYPFIHLLCVLLYRCRRRHHLHHHRHGCRRWCCCCFWSLFHKHIHIFLNRHMIAPVFWFWNFGSQKQLNGADFHK